MRDYSTFSAPARIFFFPATAAEPDRGNFLTDGVFLIALGEVVAAYCPCPEAIKLESLHKRAGFPDIS